MNEKAQLMLDFFDRLKDLPAGKVLFDRRSYLFAVRAQARRKPLPKISLELVTIMKALGSWAFR